MTYEAETIKEPFRNPVEERRVFAIRYRTRKAVSDFDYLIEGESIALDENLDPSHPFLKDQLRKYGRRGHNTPPFDLTTNSCSWHVLLRSNKVPLEKLLEAVDSPNTWIQTQA